MLKKKFLIFIIFSSIFLSNLGCETLTSMGNKEFISFAELKKKKLTFTQHKKIVQQFGGIYKNEKLQNYIENLTMLLITSGNIKNINIKVKILNTPVINSFSFPGDYIYITRGIIFYCQNEAQFAGIIANEISHLLLGYVPKIFAKNIKEDLLAKVKLSTELSDMNRIKNFYSSPYFLKYSKIQENNANKLATELMIKAGFDPKEIVNFLNNIKDMSNLQNEIFGSKNSQNSNFFFTHPTSPNKIIEIIQNTSEKISYNPIIGKEIFLKKIDGLLYGMKPAEGFFFKNKFINKNLDFAFDFDESIYFYSVYKKLIGIIEKKSKIIFDVKTYKNEIDRLYFSQWAKVSEKKIHNFEKFLVNDFIGFTCLTDNDNNVLRLVIITNKDMAFRFSLISPKEEFESADKQLSKILSSFQSVKTNEKLYKIPPPKVKILSLTDEKEISLFLKEINLQKKNSFKELKNLNGIKNKLIDVPTKIKTIY